MEEKKVYARQFDIVRPSELNFPILIVGAGGIGSWVTLTLAKMGCGDITVIDFDTVEEYNIPSQFYSEAQRGQKKVAALAESVLAYTGVTIKTIDKKYQDISPEEKNKNYSIIILAVDSLDQRREIWQQLMQQTVQFDVLIDARMANELIRMFVASPYAPSSMVEYTNSLNPKKAPHEEPCTSRAVVYNTFMCGGLIGLIVKKFAKKESVKKSLTFDITNLEIITPRG